MTKTKTDIIVIGAGGHAAEIDEYILYNKKVSGDCGQNIIGFLDDNPANYSSYHFSAPLLGPITEDAIINGHAYMIGIANLKFRRSIVERFKSKGARFVSFSHCTAYISPTSVIGEGSIIGPNVNIGPNVQIGKYTLINSRCSLGHDTVMGDYNFISPNVCFSGFSSIGDENFFGINSATIPGIRIGGQNKVSAGMILDKDIENETVVFHRFKEKVIAVPRSNK